MILAKSLIFYLDNLFGYWTTEYGSYIKDLKDTKGLLIQKVGLGKVAWTLEAVGEIRNTKELFSKLVKVKVKKNK